MTLSAKGTNNRRVLDSLRGVRSRNYGSISKTLSDIANPAINKILSDEIEKGNISKNAAGYRLTGVALKLYDIENELNKVEYKDNFKPLDRSRFINARGNREGSNDHLEWRSKHV